MPPGTWQERSWISLAWNTDPLRDGRVWKQMESYKEIEKSLLGRKITARLQFLDEGLNVPSHRRGKIPYRRSQRKSSGTGAGGHRVSPDIGKGTWRRNGLKNYTGPGKSLCG